MLQGQTKRITAEFVPQAWVNDNAIIVDPKGETTWDVTDEILRIEKEKGALYVASLQDDQYETDEFRYSANAPQWVKDWCGPFYIRVEQAIQDYYEEDAQ